MRRVVVGDTNRTGSEAQFTVGPLRCHGDSELQDLWFLTCLCFFCFFLMMMIFFVYLLMSSTGNIWNTIAFTKPTYITFPPFRPGSSADISFHFKTYRDHGVFLENSDDHLKNFIRIELNSEFKEPFLVGMSDIKWYRTVGQWWCRLLTKVMGYCMSCWHQHSTCNPLIIKIE